MAQHRIYTMTFSAVYPLYVAKATRKGRTNEEVDTVIRWLTGYTKKGLETQIRRAVTLEEFFAKAPKLSPLRSLITGVICGVQIEDITDPLMREVRYLDKLIDELAKGRPMEKILRQGSASPETQIKKSGSTVHQDILRYHAMQDPSCAPSARYWQRRYLERFLRPQAKFGMRILYGFWMVTPWWDIPSSRMEYGFYSGAGNLLMSRD